MSYVVPPGFCSLIVLYTERWKTTYGFACGLATYVMTVEKWQLWLRPMWPSVATASVAIALGYSPCHQPWSYGFYGSAKPGALDRPGDGVAACESKWLLLSA